MYGKFLYVFGIAFILFMAAILLGTIFRSGFSSIFRILISRLLVTLFISTVCFAIGLVVYSLYTGVPITEAFDSVYKLFLEKINEI
jgi:hypothetical protein